MCFVIKDNIVSIKKDCTICTHINVCKFHSKMKKLCKSDEFYEMTKYPEWNNSLKAFERNASCQYFKLNFEIPKDGSLNLDMDGKLINAIIDNERQKNKWTMWSVKIKENLIIFSNKDQNDKNVKITDILSEYKFSQK